MAPYSVGPIYRVLPFPLGWDRARARQPGRWRVTVLALSVCEAGSQFHQGYVSRGPPIMPDVRIAQVRFEALAFRPWAFPFTTRFKRWCAYPPSLTGLLLASSLALAGVDMLGFIKPNPRLS